MIFIVYISYLNSISFAGDPMHGDWAQWTQWSSCSVNCGNGTYERTRYCDNPAPRNGGTDCVGSSKETQPCILPSCSGTVLSAAGSSCTTLCQSLGALNKAFFCLFWGSWSVLMSKC